MNIKDQIRYLLAAKFTQAEIAEQIGVTQPLISMITNGKAKYDLKFSVASKLDAMVRKQQRRDRRGVSQ